MEERLRMLCRDAKDATSEVMSAVSDAPMEVRLERAVNAVRLLRDAIQEYTGKSPEECTEAALGIAGGERSLDSLLRIA